jgi:hypothetical protein
MDGVNSNTQLACLTAQHGVIAKGLTRGLAVLRPCSRA